MNLKVHYRIHNTPILSQTNPVHITPSHLSKTMEFSLVFFLEQNRSGFWVEALVVSQQMYCCILHTVQRDTMWTLGRNEQSSKLQKFAQNFKRHTEV
jgi:hypothetical protein